MIIGDMIAVNGVRSGRRPNAINAMEIVVT